MRGPRGGGGFDEDQAHRAMRPGVAGAAAGGMLAQAARRIRRPAGVVSPVGAFDDVAVVRRHGADYSLRLRWGVRDSLAEPLLCRPKPQHFFPTRYPLPA